MAYVTILTTATGPDGTDDFYSDYITNESKRWQDWTTSSLPSDYWTVYDNVYDRVRSDGSLLFRSKHVDANNTLHITQVWRDQAAREQFLTDINDTVFNAGITITKTYENYEASSTEIQDLVASIAQEPKCIIQICADEYKLSGMSIGDPMKGDVIFTVP